MTIKSPYKPLLFYSLSLYTTWLFWFTAAYTAPSTSGMTELLELAGLACPAVIALILIYNNSLLHRDFIQRFHTVFFNIQPLYMVITFLLMPTTIVIAQGLSLLYGYSINQFSLSPSMFSSFSIFSTVLMSLIAPLLEEAAWHTYGTDSLHASFTLFKASLIFGLFWVVWHMPLIAIKGSYHNTLLTMGYGYLLNFASSLIPLTLLINWLYYKTNRNSLVAFLFHSSANISNEIFSTHPDSKIFQTVLLAGIAGFIVYKERELFFEKKLTLNR